MRLDDFDPEMICRQRGWEIVLRRTPGDVFGEWDCWITAWEYKTAKRGFGDTAWEAMVEALPFDYQPEGYVQRQYREIE